MEIPLRAMMIPLQAYQQISRRRNLRKVKEKSYQNSSLSQKLCPYSLPLWILIKHSKYFLKLMLIFSLFFRQFIQLVILSSFFCQNYLSVAFVISLPVIPSLSFWSDFRQSASSQSISQSSSHFSNSSISVII